MNTTHELESVFERIAKDLPWGQTVRLVVGSLSSREAVKDHFFEWMFQKHGNQAVAIPGPSICGLTDLAKEVVQVLAPERAQKAMAQPSRLDALQLLAGHQVVKSRAPDFAKHLRMRPVASKLARFLTDIDLHASQGFERTALVEAAGERDPQLAAILSVVEKLWESQDLEPWSEASALRLACDLLAKPENRERANLLPKEIFIWAHSHFTPLEFDLVEALQKLAEVEIFEPTVPSKLTPQAKWRPHSVWDECAFLHRELKVLQDRGLFGPGQFSDTAIFVPNDELYKRVVRSELHAWNVPLKDPTLPHGWRENPTWLWWRNTFAAITSGLRLDDVRAVIGAGANADAFEARRKLYDLCYKRGVTGSASQWRKLAQECNIPELRLLVELAAVFGRSMTCADFQDAVRRVDAEKAEWGAAQESACDTGILTEFAEELVTNRPYLSTFRGRLNRYLPLFEEFLENRGRRESLRSIDGVWFVAHGVWLPKRVKHAFVLGSYCLGDLALASADALEWEGNFSAERIREKQAVARLWQRLHSLYDEDVGRSRGFRSTLHSLQACESVVISEPTHTVSGSESSRSLFLRECIADQEPLVHRSGGDASSGWDLGLESPLVAPILNLSKQKDVIFERWKTKGLRISAFEDYLKCPFVFYARHVLGLEIEQEPGLDLAGRVKGDLLHRVLERVLRRELEENVSLESMGLNELAAILDEEMLSRSLEGLFRDTALRKKARAYALDLIMRWHAYEIQYREKFPSLRPWKLEQSLEFELASGLKLTGRADRIDSDGSHFVVIDYKSSGGSFNGRELREGLGAQLVSYALATRNKFEREPAGVWYLELGRQVSNRSGIFLKKFAKVFHSAHHSNSGLVDASFDQVSEPILERWSEAAERLLGCDFSPRPARTKECDRCRYQDVCGFPVGVEDAHAPVDG